MSRMASSRQGTRSKGRPKPAPGRWLTAGPSGATRDDRTARLTVTRATLAVVAIGLLWRTIRYALAFPLWGDEAFVAVNFLTRTLSELRLPLEFDQIAPPGFLWVEWFAARLLGPSEWALRLVPYLAGVGGLLVFWRFCRRVASRRSTLLAVAVLAASVYPVRHANEVKPYATDLLVSLLITAAGWSVWRDPRSRRRWLTLIGTAGAGVWCSYTAAYPAGSVAMLLALRLTQGQRQGDSGTTRPLPRRTAGFLPAYLVVLGISFGAVVYLFASPQASAGAWLSESVTWRGAFPPLAQPWRLPWWLLDMHAGGMLAYPWGSANFGSTASLLLVVLGVRAMARHKERRPLLLLLLGPIPIALAAAALHRHPYGTCIRVTIYMAPAFCLLMGEGIVALLKARRVLRGGSLVVAALFLLIPIGFTVRDVAKPYTRWDDLLHRRMARALAAQTRTGDRWIVFNGATPPPRDVPDLMVSRWIQRVAEVRFYLLQAAPVPTLWEPDPNAVNPVPGGRTWLIVHRHGSRRAFPETRLATYQRALDARLGPRVATQFFSFPEGESVEARVYPGPLLKQ